MKNTPKKLSIKKAKTEDFNVLYEILKDCSLWLGEKNINQWQKLYPEKIFKKDIMSGYVYYFESEGQIVGTVSLPSKKPFYYPKEIFSDTQKSWYICRLAVSRKFNGQGIGAQILKEIEEEAKKKGVKVLRLDVVKDNPFLSSYYEKHGFNTILEADVFDAPSVFMEKKICRSFLHEKIESERLLLVSSTQAHAPDIFREFTSEITTYMWPLPPEKISDTEDFIRESREKMEVGTDLQLTIFNKDTLEFLGGGGLHSLDKIPEFGIWIKKAAHGHKYGQEAVEAIKKWAGENIEYDYLIYPVAKDNMGSRKLAEAMGGKIFKEWEGTPPSGRKSTFVEYQIFK